MASSSSSSCVDHRYTYDVFLSFRGADVRTSFMDHLFSTLKRKGIFPFRDDRELKFGDKIDGGLTEAITKSRVLVVVFTENYASSTWCLDELLQMVRYNETAKDLYHVRALFYDVEPSVVQKCGGNYHKDLDKHEKRGSQQVSHWKQALAKAAHLPGWDFQKVSNVVEESTFIDGVSRDIFKMLSNNGPLDLGENLVGLDSRAVKMNLLQFVDPRKVHMVGICGISGVGKTITARAIYNLLHIHFEGSSFCEDVKGTAKMHGLPYVQNQLIDDITKAGDEYITSVGQGISVTKQLMSSKNVLIVLDDVSCIEQLKALAGSPSWFGPGSLIIVTGKDRQLFSAHGVEEIFEIELLDQNESIELFSLYAFKKTKPTDEFIDLSYSVVNFVNGHPLALKVLGCFLFGKDVQIWTSEVDKLRSYNTFEIQQVLKLSYEGLDSNQKDIFLDIACFFHNQKQDFVMKILDACNLFPETDLRVLVDKSFLTISRGQLKLHELIKKMGKQVVREESENAGKRSRLWSQKDSYRVLNQSMGSESVKGFRLRLTSCPKVYIDSESFSRMKELRMLKIHYKLLESTLPHGIYHRNIIFEGTKVNHSKNLEFLSNELRWLCWHGYPFEFLPANFLPKYLVAINLSYGNIKQLWTGTKSFEKLTIMELRFCHHLTNTPDFTLIPNLEELHLEYCTNLVELHPSVGLLKKLIILNCNNCKKLKYFPRDLELESLQTLILSGCSMLDSLPEDLGKSKALLELRADKTNIEQFPSSIKYLSNIRELSIGGCKKIPPRSIKSIFSHFLLPWKQQNSALILPPLSGLRLIKNLDVSHRKLSEANLKDISSLLSLEKLNLSGNDFVSLPSNFSELSGLKRLGLVGCKNLEILPVLPSTIDIIDAQDCTALKKLPSIMYESKFLRFDFSNCSKLAENQTIESLASMLLPQRRVDPYRAVNLFLPGTRVPEWFTNRNDGDCLRIELPQPWSYSKFKGFATCAVFSPQNPKGSKGRMIEVSYTVRNLKEALLCGTAIETRIFPNETRCYESDQVWLSYMVPRPGWEFRWEKAKDYIEVEFEIYGIYCKVKECGVRLIYEEDEAESSSRITEWLPHAVENNDNINSAHSDNIDMKVNRDDHETASPGRS